MVTLEAEEVYALAPYAKTLGVEFEEMTAAGVQAVPSSSQARSGSMPGTPGSRTGSDQGPAGSVAVKSMLPSLLTLVTISQKRPSWWRRVGA